MTQEEIKSSIAKIEANSAIPEKQKTLLLEKYKKMLSEATGKKPEPPAPAAKPAASKKSAAPKKKAEAPAKKVATPKPAASSSNEEYNCDDLIADIKSKKAKQKARAKEKANEPKKTPATKNKEAVEKVVSKVTAGVEKRIDTKKVSISEIEKLIDGAKEYLKTLEGILTKAKDAGIMATGGSVDNEVYSNFAKEAKSIKVGHCGCSGAKMAKGGQMESFAAWFNENKEGDLAQDYRNYKSQLESESKEDVLSFREWAKEQYESGYAKEQGDATTIKLGDVVRVDYANDNNAEKYKIGDTFTVKMMVHPGSDNEYYFAEDIQYLFHPSDLTVISKGEYGQGGKVTSKGYIEYADGYQYKKVSRAYVQKHWEDEEIFGIHLEDNSEALIESESDIDDFEYFGISLKKQPKPQWEVTLMLVKDAARDSDLKTPELTRAEHRVWANSEKEAIKIAKEIDDTSLSVWESYASTVE